MGRPDDALSPQRVAFVRVRELALSALLRVEPELALQPLAVLDVAHDLARAGALPQGYGAARVIACTAAARALGVAVGQTGHQARAVAPDLRLRGSSTELAQRARAALLDAVATVGARLAPAPHGVWVDAAELSGMYESEAGLGAALTEAPRRVGLEVSVGIAGNLGVAAVAARRGGVTVIPAGEEGRYLGPLPLEALPISEALRAELRRFGVTRVAELARLPVDAAGLRLGEEAARAVRLARGEDDRPLVPHALPARFEEGVELEWEVQTVEPLLFVTRRVLDALVARLSCRGLGVGGMVLSLDLVSRVSDERALPIAAPTRDVPTLFALVRSALERQCLPDAVRALRITALPQPLRATQLGLFDPPGPAPERLALTLSRLAALVGDDRVGAPSAPDTHRPYAAAVTAFDPPRTPREPDAGRARAMALHVYRPPREVEVTLSAGAPVGVRSGEVRGRVVACSGPWRVQGEWWAEAYAHEGYDVELEDGGLYLIAYDPLAERWRLDGVYE